MGQNVNEAKPSLLDRTRELLADRRRTLTLRMISEDTGLSYAFLYHLSADNASDYGVRKVQTLYEYLAGRSLDVA